MKTLAIDTSSKVCTVSILDNDDVLINLYNDDEKTHSVKLMPMIDEAFKKTNLNLYDMNLLACCIGPGSFTGVRIGIATIKSFSDVTNIPVVGVSSLEGLAYNVQEQVSESTLVCSIIDAKNNNVYCGLYNFKNDNCNKLSIFAEDINKTISNINHVFKTQNFDNIFFVGDGSVVHKDLLESTFSNTTFANEKDNYQNSISIAKSGMLKYHNGEYGDSSTISPIYLKKSQAERALEEKIEISQMTHDDIELISKNFNEEFDKFWSVDNLKNDFNNPNSSYFIAKLNDEIVGFVGTLKIIDELNIMNIATKVNKRSLGIASKLLSYIIDYSKSIGCKSITLEVNENNLPAIHLYEKFNFKRIGLRKKYYNNTDNAILMTLLV